MVPKCYTEVKQEKSEKKPPDFIKMLGITSVKFLGLPTGLQ